uniref:Uncharacterized protein n=1 Tax=Fagus sylvatica TaxID=28930 RepID=A0A2N9IH18_FAGSY
MKKKNNNNNNMKEVGIEHMGFPVHSQVRKIKQESEKIIDWSTGQPELSSLSRVGIFCKIRVDGGWIRVTVAFGLGFGFHFSSVCSLTVSGLGFSGGFWVDGGWSRGSSSRGSPVCRGFEVGLGFWGCRGSTVGLPWVWVGLRWVLGFGAAVGLPWVWVGLRWVLGFGAAVGLPWVCRGVAMGLPWVWGCHGSWESTAKKKKKKKNEEREKENEEREKKS